MATIIAFDALGYGLNMPATGSSYIPPSDAVNVGQPEIVRVDADTILFYQRISSSSGTTSTTSAK